MDHFPLLAIVKFKICRALDAAALTARPAKRRAVRVAVLD
jgi:hypothetical protein